MRNIKELMEYAEQQLRKLCKKRDLDWDAMNDEEKIEFINKLVHEDRECESCY